MGVSSRAREHKWVKYSGCGTVEAAKMQETKNGSQSKGSSYAQLH